MTSFDNWTRRQTMAGMAAFGVAACSGGTTQRPPVIGTPRPNSSAGAIPAPSLNAIAQRSGRRFGSAISYNTRSNDSASVQNPDYTAIIRSECGVVVGENEMKWQAIRPGPDSYDFTRFDGIVAWAQANGQAVRGHTLLWHRARWFPDWLNTYDFGANRLQEAERLLVDHIRTVTDRYRGVISSYDVVNEAIDHDSNTTIETSLSRAMGSPEAVLDLAFHTARDQVPGVQLVYNDYMSWEPAHRAHCRDVLRLLEGFRARGTPVDALGIQSHIEMFSIDPATGLGPYAEREWRAFLDEVVAMGYDLVITEFDVKEKALPADIAQRDAAVADYARRYFDIMLEYDQLGDILAWGMVDKFSWLQGFAPRDDGLEVRACPYASNYRPKPLRDALAQSFEQAAG